MLVRAIYEETGEPCFVNMDFVIDIMRRKEGNWVAYTFDNERGGYIIEEEELQKCINEWNLVVVEEKNKYKISF